MSSDHESKAIRPFVPEAAPTVRRNVIPHTAVPTRKGSGLLSRENPFGRTIQRKLATGEFSGKDRLGKLHLWFETDLRKALVDHGAIFNFHFPDGQQQQFYIPAGTVAIERNLAPLFQDYQEGKAIRRNINSDGTIIYEFGESQNGSTLDVWIPVQRTCELLREEGDKWQRAVERLIQGEWDKENDEILRLLLIAPVLEEDVWKARENNEEVKSLDDSDLVPSLLQRREELGRFLSRIRVITKRLPQFRSILEHLDSRKDHEQRVISSHWAEISSEVAIIIEQLRAFVGGEMFAYLPGASKVWEDLFRQVNLTFPSPIAGVARAEGTKFELLVALEKVEKVLEVLFLIHTRLIEDLSFPSDRERRVVGSIFYSSPLFSGLDDEKKALVINELPNFLSEIEELLYQWEQVSYTSQEQLPVETQLFDVVRQTAAEWVFSRTEQFLERDFDASIEILSNFLRSTNFIERAESLAITQDLRHLARLLQKGGSEQAPGIVKRLIQALSPLGKQFTVSALHRVLQFCYDLQWLYSLDAAELENTTQLSVSQGMLEVWENLLQSLDPEELHGLLSGPSLQQWPLLQWMEIMYRVTILHVRAAKSETSGNWGITLR